MGSSRICANRRWLLRLLCLSLLTFFCFLLVSLTSVPLAKQDRISKERSYENLAAHQNFVEKVHENFVQKVHQNYIQTGNARPQIPSKNRQPENQIVAPMQLKLSAFTKLMLSYDWAGFSATTDQSDRTEHRTKEQVHDIEIRQQDLMRTITPYLKMEPLVPINAACAPPKLTPPTDLNCKGHGNIFNGQQRSGPVPKIGILVQFGFGVDVLEIYLNEVYDVVDRFFIIESTRAHFRTIKKPLLWENVKYQPRFQKFSDKVIHLVLDDAEAAGASEVYEANIVADKKFEMEGLQEHLRWSKFLQWNAAHKFFEKDDFLGMGDADEIPSRERIHMLRHCQVTANQFDMGIWFSFGNVNYAFRTDWPVPGHAYTLGDPTFWTLDAAKAYDIEKEPPSRMRGRSGTGKYLLGGMHMTHSGYLPFQIARRISCSECWPFLPREISFIVENLKNGKVRAVEEHMGAVPGDLRSRNFKLSGVRKQMNDVAILPWFYACNRNRYPSWEGQHDTRLD